MKRWFKQMLRHLPGGISGKLQGWAWMLRSRGLWLLAPCLKRFCLVAGGRSPFSGLPSGVVGLELLDCTVNRIAGVSAPPACSASTLGEMTLDDFADCPAYPESIVLADLAQARVDGATSAVMDRKGRFITELSTYSKCSSVESPWDHPIFLQFRDCVIHEIPGTALLLANPNGKVYFHWLLELLPRLGLFEAVGMLPADFVCLVPQSGRFIIDSLVAAGVPLDKVEVMEPRVQYRVGRLLATSDLMPQSMVATLAPLLREQLLDQANGARNFPSLVYITRRQSGLRTVVQERKLIELIEEFGGQAVALEDLSIQEQARLFNEATCIVAPHGSALANLAFCRPGTKVLELFAPSYVRLLYPRMGTALELDYWYLIGKGERERHGQPMLYADIDVDEAHFKATLQIMLEQDT